MSNTDAGAGGLPADVGRHLRATLAAIEAGKLSCSAATRHRIEGAVLALDAMAAMSTNDRLLDN